MSRRIDRISVLLQEELGRMIHSELHDPRLDRVVSVVRAEVSSDLQHAKVTISALGGDQVEREALQALRSASGYLRRELGQRLRLRRTPELRFMADVATREGDRVLSLLDDLRRE